MSGEQQLERIAQRLGVVLSARASKTLFLSRNLTALGRAGRARVLVKAAPSHLDGGVDAEASVLPWVEARLRGVPHAPRVPHVVASMPGALAVGWLPGASLYTVRRRAHATSLDVRLGRALAAVHGATQHDAAQVGRDVSGDIVRPLVWTSPQLYASMSPATAALWREVQHDAAAEAGLVALLDAEGRAPKVLVHGDARHPNILVGPRHLALLDWEVAGLGDGARDVGMLMAEELAEYLVPSPGRMVVTLPALRRRWTGLWRGYRQGAKASAMPVDDDFLERAVGWAGEALLRRVYTRTFHGGPWDDTARHVAASGRALVGHPATWAAHFLTGAR